MLLNSLTFERTYVLNSTQLNFIDERIKITTDIVIKNKHKLNYSETDTTIKATTYSAKIYRN